MRWICAVLLVLALPTAASAAPALNGTFDVSGMPKYLTLGSDGNIWFTLEGSSTLKEFGRVTPGGTVTEYDTKDDHPVTGITTGPDGKLWMTAASFGLVRVDPANPGATAQDVFPNANMVGAHGIVAGPDNNLWTASADKIFKTGLNNGLE